MAEVPPERHVQVTKLDHQFYRVVAHIGFMERPNVIARRALDGGEPVAPDAGPGAAEAESASGELAETLPGGEDIASDRISRLDPEARAISAWSKMMSLPSGCLRREW